MIRTHHLPYDILKPPAEGDDFRMLELWHIIIDKIESFDRLILSLHNENPLLASMSAIGEFRKQAFRKYQSLSIYSGINSYLPATCNKLFNIASQPSDVAEVMTGPLWHFRMELTALASWVEDASMDTTNFRNGVKQMSARVAEGLKANGKHSNFAKSNKEIVEAMFHAIDESIALLRRRGEYYRVTAQRIEDYEFDPSAKPSESKLNSLRNQWNAYFLVAEAVRVDCGKLPAQVLKITHWQ